ncbi:MAG: dihydroorotate dehydrogenase B catalytic subunit [Deltaproteobacteria bacterium RBG_13_52_11b]|nr:MAG: dihydroorotate dehydrogenase B catalytic subunit [Deltaproteobacteria bacterium RBG_13_52_11b]
MTEVPDLSVTIGRMKLKNPVMVASGTFGFGEEYQDFLDLNQLGAILPKGISLRPVAGNPPPRIFETEGGMLNAIGLQNPGVDLFIKEKLPFLRTLDTCLIVNFFGNSEKEYVELAERLDRVPGISGLEMNVSCPNMSRGGIVFCTDPRMTYELVRDVRRATTLTLVVKLSPNVTDITAMARSAEDAGADAVSLVNTFRAMAINIHSRKPELGNVFGGLSGPAIKPIALRMVWEVSQAIKIPVIGMGGIAKAEDAVEFVLAGASAVQVGTANLVHPATGIEVVHGIRKYLIQYRMDRFQALIGLSKKTLPRQI